MPATVPPCRPAQITIVADDRGGDFTGMSHGGSWLFLRNGSTRACALPARPAVRLLDRHGRPLPALRRAATAPQAPVTVAAGRQVRLSLRWVSGPVFEHSRCLTAIRVTVRIGTGASATPLDARLCGARGKPVRFDQTPLEPIEDYPAE